MKKQGLAVSFLMLLLALPAGTGTGCCSGYGFSCQ